jgi:hypothetical protein
MAQTEVSVAESRSGGHRKGRRRKRRTRKKLIHNLKWILGGVAAGLPVLALLIYLVSNF